MAMSHAAHAELELPRAWVATSNIERRRANALRHEVFCDSGLEVCTARRPGDNHDSYDQLAAHFGVDYRGRTIGSMRLILGDTPTESLYPWIPGAPDLVPGRRYAEPSRLGILSDYRGREVGMAAQLALIGQGAITAMELGFTEFVIIVLPDMLGSVSFFPLVLSPPFLYPATEGGPSQELPVWAGTLNLHEMAVATLHYSQALYRDDRLYRAMFPQEPAWDTPTNLRSISQIKALAKSNRRQRQATVRKWKAHALELPTLSAPPVNGAAE
jgi:hypothetical protein